MDSSEQLIADSLSKHAADAPSDDRLLAAVHARLRRRRTGRTIGAVVVAAAAVATAITASHGVGAFTKEPQTAQAPAPGWHWESFRTVQVQVPSSWTQYISGPAPCSMPVTPAAPVIGRLNGWPGSSEYTCGTAVLPLAKRQQYLWFNDVQAPGIKRYDGGWTEETRVVGGVKLSVLTKDDALRRKILDSARPITSTDFYGCSPHQPAKRPIGTPDVQVTSASICEYWNGSLIAGSAVPADRVLEITGQLLAPPQPRDPGPIPAGCKDSRARTFVVLLEAEGRTWQVHLSFTRCVPYTGAALAIAQLGPHHQLQPFDAFVSDARVAAPRR